MQTTTQLVSELAKAVNFYCQSGFIAKVVMVDSQFASVQEEVPEVETDGVATCEHAAEIE